MKHGMKGHRLYRTWYNMKRRCHAETNKDYSYYGGRGIEVCEKWRDSPVEFIAWAEDKFEEGLTLDRIDNDGNYCPENCRFVSRTVQQHNTRADKRNISGTTGVTWQKGAKKWRARAQVNGKRFYLGCYDNRRDAISARAKWEETHPEIKEGV